jgi:hypothetical protein
MYYAAMINANIFVFIVKSFHFTPEWGSVEITKVMLYMLNEVMMMMSMMMMLVYVK